MSTTAPRTEHGLTSLSVIAALAILAVLIAITERALHDTTAIVSALITSERALTRSTEKLLEELTFTSPESGLIRRSVSARWGTTPAYLRSLELHLSPVGMSQKPLYTRTDGPIPSFDTAALFVPRAMCPVVGPASFEATPHTEPLTTTAAVATTTCSIASPLLPSPPRFGENLVVTAPIQIDHPHLPNPPTAIPALLTSRGFIEIRADLIVARPTIVFAGGDIFIDRIVGASPGAEATLITPTGRVIVRALTGAPRVRIIAYAGATLPSGATLSTAPSLPPVVPGRLLGFTRGVE